MMRMTMFCFAIGLAALLNDTQRAEARPWFPWCAQYADRRAATECAFATFEQCLATVSGIGGSCIQNWYPPPPVEPRRQPRRFYR
jgi:hypothetical protein